MTDIAKVKTILRSICNRDDFWARQLSTREGAAKILQIELLVNKVFSC